MTIRRNSGSNREMGCNQSMIENQAVSLCKDRNHFIKEAVSSRDTLAAAHSAYSICLKNTGAALCDFISGEFPHLSFVGSDSFSTRHVAYSSSPIELPPPPPLPDFRKLVPLERAAGMPIIKQKAKTGATIMEDDKPELEDRNNEKSAKKRSNTSDAGSSSEGESYYSCDRADQSPPPQPVLPVQFHKPAVGKPGLKKGGIRMGRRFTNPVSLMQIFAGLDRHFLKASASARELSQMLGYTGLHHHSSSVDNTVSNREMGCNQSMIESQEVSLCKDRNHFIKEAVSSRNALSAAYSAYSIYLKNTGAALCDFISAEFSHVCIENISFPTQRAAYSSSPIELPPPPPPPHLPNGATIKEDDIPELEERNNEKFAKKRSNASEADPTLPVPHHQPVFPVPFHMPAMGKIGPKKGGVKMGRRSTKPMSLMQIFADLDTHFLKAFESARELSQMLGDTRSHDHSSSVDHFKRVMRIITWKFQFEGMPNVDDDKDEFDTEENDTHFTVLNKMLAWEKILYNEVKARDTMKYEYRKKVSKQGGCPESLEKLKADENHLHTKYFVNMQYFESTVEELNHLRDDQLYPNLVKLVERMETHWKSMHYHHETQCKIVYAMKLLDKSEVVGDTTEYHNGPTILLCDALHKWHKQFYRLILCEKQYIRALHSWIKLTLIPVESTLPNIQNPPIYALLTAWINDLDKLPDEVVDSAIFNFAVMVNTILHNHDEEIKMREKCEETRKEIEQKSRQFEEWCKKHGVTEEMNPDNPLKVAKEQREAVVVSLRTQLEKDEEECRKICRHVREKTLDSLKNGLPEIFHAMTEISLAYSVMYSSLRSNAKKTNTRGQNL